MVVLTMTLTEDEVNSITYLFMGREIYEILIRLARCDDVRWDEQKRQLTIDGKVLAKYEYKNNSLNIAKPFYRPGGGYVSIGRHSVLQVSPKLLLSASDSVGVFFYDGLPGRKRHFSMMYESWCVAALFGRKIVHVD